MSRYGFDTCSPSIVTVTGASASGAAIINDVRNWLDTLPRMRTLPPRSPVPYTRNGGKPSRPSIRSSAERAQSVYQIRDGALGHALAAHQA